jgi:outer membrane receptor protein involved in Fe transport
MFQIHPCIQFLVPVTAQFPVAFPVLKGQLQTVVQMHSQATLKTLFNITTRRSLSLDGVYTKRLFGQQHSFKGGYQRNRLANNIRAGSAAGSIIIHYGQLSPSCNCMGTYGYYQTNTSGQKGDVNSTNQGFFVQDAWQAHRRVTLNLGLRVENEFVPSFPLDPTGHPGLDVSEISLLTRRPRLRFGWGDKIAPRLGGAWDVLAMAG